MGTKKNFRNTDFHKSFLLVNLKEAERFLKLKGSSSLNKYNLAKFTLEISLQMHSYTSLLLRFYIVLYPDMNITRTWSFVKFHCWIYLDWSHKWRVLGHFLTMLTSERVMWFIVYSTIITFEVQHVVCNRKVSAFLFETTFLYVGGYSATNSKAQALFI